VYPVITVGYLLKSRPVFPNYFRPIQKDRSTIPMSSAIPSH
jgi:hypothetical protein